MLLKYVNDELTRTINCISNCSMKQIILARIYDINNVILIIQNWNDIMVLIKQTRVEQPQTIKWLSNHACQSSTIHFEFITIIQLHFIWIIIVCLSNPYTLSLWNSIMVIIHFSDDTIEFNNTEII